ncbi:MAG: phage tail tube protein [Planctomycetota bacterium]
MSIVRCKGTALKQKIASVYTAVAQVISIDGPELESETFEADTLDNASAGIPYEHTGRSEGGKVSGELFFDPALAGHQAMLALITTPASQDWKLAFVDAAVTEASFTGAGFSLSPTVALKEGLKAKFSIKLDGIPTWAGTVTTTTTAA